MGKGKNDCPGQRCAGIVIVKTRRGEHPDNIYIVRVGHDGGHPAMRLTI